MIDSYPVEWEDSLTKVLAMDWSWAGCEQNLPFVLRRSCTLWGRGT
jgi:hypothetical protein